MLLSRWADGLASAFLTLFISESLAQYNEMAEGTYRNAETGITLATYAAPPRMDGNGSFVFGLALPENAKSKDATEYIGMLRCQSINAELTGWCGLAHAGHMVQDLLLMAWPHEGQVLTSFRWANDYMPPDVYHGNATATQISSWVNATGYELIYRCQNCFSWSGNSYTEAVATSGEAPMIFGYAQAAQGPLKPDCPGQITFGMHNNGYAQWEANIGNAANPSYPKWAAMATKAVSDTCAHTTGTASATEPAATTATTTHWPGDCHDAGKIAGRCIPG